MIERVLNRLAGRIADHFMHKPPPTLQEAMVIDLGMLAECVAAGEKPRAQMWFQRCQMRFERWQADDAE